MLEREVAIYKELQKFSFQVAFVTYGIATDLRFAGQIPNIQILCNKWNLPAPLYEFLIPLLHRSQINNCDIIKSNQSNGADVALRAAQLWKKPMIARSGYSWTEFLERGSSSNQKELAKAQRIEHEVFSTATKIVVTTQAMKERIRAQYDIDQERIAIIPNFVLSDQFIPTDFPSILNRLCFVGRLVPQKNVHNLIRACKGLDIELVIVGDGPQRDELEAFSNEINVSTTFLGNRPHSELPEILRMSTIFLLVSHYEGHPKTLLEAMSCGLPVIGANSPGIREVIQHGETGLLCDPHPASIREAIERLLQDRQLSKKLGRNARKHILEEFSLQKVTEIEVKVIQEILRAD